jgi:hypothetical protein
MSTTPPITDQPITATDPRVAQVLALIKAKAEQGQVAPVAPAPSTATIAPVPTPNAPVAPQPVPTQLQAALQQSQAAQNIPTPQPSNLPPMQGATPQIPASPQPQVTQGAGPVKSFLQSLVSGLGGAAYQGTQGALQRLGIPTDYEKQQNALKIGLQQQQQDSLEGFRRAQQGLYEGKGAQLDQLTAPYAIAKDDQSVLPQFRGKSTTFGGYQALQKLSGQTQGKTDVANINAQSGMVPMTPEFAQRLGIPQLAGQPVTAKALTSYSKLLNGAGLAVQDIGGRSVVFDKSQVNSPNHGIVQDLGPSTKIIQAGIYANNRSMQVVDPNDPNATIMMSPAKANAIGAQGTQSVGYQANKAITRYFTSGEGAKNLNAFNTATAHLQQLGGVADALNNGDTQLVNKLGNNFGQQTGNPAPTNFDAVKTAVSGEIAKVFKGGGATDQEISEMNGTINRAESPAQLKGVINTYTSLMNSKKEALQQQYTQGKQGAPNFSPNSPKDGTTKVNSSGDKVIFKNGKWSPA